MPKTSLIDKKLCKKIFQKIDADNSKALDAQELQRALETVDIQMSGETLQSLIELVDENYDGLMQLEEFTHFMYICQNSDPKDTKSVLFYAADTDYQGSISKAKLATILKKIGAPMTREQIDELFSEIADNPDGTLSYEMFVGLVGELMGEEKLAADSQTIETEAK